MEELCIIEVDGRARCTAPGCAKIFKGAEFLIKHIRSKHLFLAAARLLSASEPVIRAKFDAEDILERPLPLIEIENNGRIETTSVREIVELCRARKQEVGTVVSAEMMIAPVIAPTNLRIPPPPAISMPPFLGDKNNSNFRDDRYRRDGMIQNQFRTQTPFHMSDMRSYGREGRNFAPGGYQQQADTDTNDRRRDKPKEFSTASSYGSPPAASFQPPPPPFFPAPGSSPAAGDTVAAEKRKFNYFVDVDAPKVS